MAKFYYKSPIGILEIIASERGITNIKFVEKFLTNDTKENIHIKKCVEELENYFYKNGKNFSVKLDIIGTEFQKKVWNELRKIPYGKIFSYKEIANKIGNPKSVRAIGMANHLNKIPIIIPCHRVIGANGKLLGYAGGIGIKKKLLELEGLKLKGETLCGYKKK